MKITNITRYILRDRRQYFIDKVKAPMVKTLVSLANKYPEPTRQNVFDPHAQAWMDIWDKFFEMEYNPGRTPLFKAIWRVFIGESAHDPYYRDRMLVLEELFIEAVLEGKIKPRSPERPIDCWKETVRNKGYAFMKDCYFKGAME